MKKQPIHKIHIFGSVGSGKTTMAKNLSKVTGIPCYEIDNAVWIRNPSVDIRRTDQEIERNLQSIVQTNSWIIEGVHTKDWVNQSWQHADIIVFLNTSYFTRTLRIIKRFIKQKLGFEKANYQPTFRLFLNMFKWNKQFEKVDKVRFLQMTEMYEEKLIIINNRQDLNNWINNL
ncbi:DNA topology modulation protein FlaR [Solibacillus daqui]|uniref:DNA topology modulation protein FlaR n=1 Tax=Solibacillus daqui TaxID=2912187 RepID=UPI00236555D9|nr:DNA topology modulation protein FlaR [Solibacillus daqui]